MIKENWKLIPEWYTKGMVPFDPVFKEVADGTMVVSHRGSPFVYPAKEIDGVWYYDPDCPLL